MRTRHCDSTRRVKGMSYTEPTEHTNKSASLHMKNIEINLTFINPCIVIWLWK